MITVTPAAHRIDGYERAPVSAPPRAPYAAPPKQKSKLGLILGVIGGVVVLCCAGGIVLVLTVDTGKKPVTRTTTAPALPAGPGYQQPADRCALADLTVLGSRVGTGEGRVFEEDSTPGCDYYLRADDGVQEVKAFTVVGDDAATRYGKDADIYTKMNGFTFQKVSGCGSQGISVVRVDGGDKRINVTVACLDQNLYVKVRFIAGGNQAWQADVMRDNMIKLANGMIAKIPKAA